MFVLKPSKQHWRYWRSRAFVGEFLRMASGSHLILRGIAL